MPKLLYYFLTIISRTIIFSIFHNKFVKKLNIISSKLFYKFYIKLIRFLKLFKFVFVLTKMHKSIHHTAGKTSGKCEVNRVYYFYSQCTQALNNQTFGIPK